MPPVYEIGHPWPERVRIEKLGPRRFRLLDDVYLRMPPGVVAGCVGTRLHGLSVVRDDIVRAYSGFEFDGPSLPSFLLPFTPDEAEHGAEGPACRHDAAYRLARLGLIPRNYRAAVDRAWWRDCAATPSVRSGKAKTPIGRAWHRSRPFRFWLGVKALGWIYFRKKAKA